MMNKDEYRSAIGKLKASDKFKEKVESSLKSSSTKSNTSKIKRLPSVIAALIIIACISALSIPHLQRDEVSSIGTNYKESSAIVKEKESSTKAEEFKIISQNSNAAANACYASIVYLDGYAYSPSGWLNYSRSESIKAEYEKIKGEKLGTVTLDLKGKSYTGTPPNFSSTYDEGTEIYTVKNMKKERAILVVDNSYTSIFYRERKALNDENTPINLTLSEVFQMMSDSPTVSSVELCSEEDASLIGVSENKQILELINKELPKLSLLQRLELGKDPYTLGKRIPINLVFSDGAALHMQVIPEAKSASVFGGYVQLSEEFCSAVQQLPKQVD